MRRLFITFIAAYTAALSVAAHAAPVVGSAAPDFSVTDAAGKPLSLASLRGKTVVLEWSNFGCPFVKKFYGAKAMQALQKDATKNGVVWISVFSSAKGKEGYMSAKEATDTMQKAGGAPSHIVMDAGGTLGRLYGAKTTPHMFVIAADGKLAYMGAIDDKPTADPADIKDAHNYVSAAIDTLKNGKPVTMNNTKPYGCSVKYAN
jgi:peroxiredoxin